MDPAQVADIEQQLGAHFERDLPDIFEPTEEWQACLSNENRGVRTIRTGDGVTALRRSFRGRCQEPRTAHR